MSRLVMALVLLASVGYGAAVIAIAARWERKWRSYLFWKWWGDRLTPQLLLLGEVMKKLGMSANDAGESIREFGNKLKAAGEANG